MPLAPKLVTHSYALNTSGHHLSQSSIRESQRDSNPSTQGWRFEPDIHFPRCRLLGNGPFSVFLRFNPVLPDFLLQLEIMMSQTENVMSPMTNMMSPATIVMSPTANIMSPTAIVC
jgi:hypothetical protein